MARKPRFHVVYIYGVLQGYCEEMLANQQVNQSQDIIIQVQSSDWWNCGLGLGSQ